MTFPQTFFRLALAALLLAGGAATAQADANTLNKRQKAIIPIAAFTANGDTAKLSEALAEALDNGLGINDAKEIIVQMYAYTGFPRSLTAMNTLMKTLDERAKQGIKDAPGPEPKELPPNADRRAIGTEIQTNLVGRPVAGPIYEFAPVMDQFLKEHLFCDVFSRGVLDNQERELATIAALAALPAEAQLASHLNVSLNTGLTPAQLEDYVAVLAGKVGQPQADLASKTLKTVLEKRKN